MAAADQVWPAVAKNTSADRCLSLQLAELFVAQVAAGAVPGLL
jgi:hypothetical protein